MILSTGLLITLKVVPDRRKVSTFSYPQDPLAAMPSLNTLARCPVLVWVVLWLLACAL